MGEPRETLRIGTWNLNHAKGVAARLHRLDLIEAMDADIWVLTETNDDHQPAGFNGVHSDPRPNSRAGGRWVSIWSRWPIDRQVPVEDPNRTACAVVRTPIGELVVFGTVLPWAHDCGEPPIDPAPRLWAEQHRVLPLQGAEWASLRTAFPRAILCVAGDLNMNLGGPHYYGTVAGRYALGEVMAGAGLECLTRCGAGASSELKYGMIDHVLIDEQLASEARVVRAWEGRTPEGLVLSDHSGAVVEVEAPS